MSTTISFRTQQQWYKDFSDYLTKSGVPRQRCFEDLLTVLFAAMAAENLRDYSIAGKYTQAIKRLQKAAQDQ